MNYIKYFAIFFFLLIISYFTLVEIFRVEIVVNDTFGNNESCDSCYSTTDFLVQLTTSLITIIFKTVLACWVLADVIMPILIYNVFYNLFKVDTDIVEQMEFNQIFNSMKQIALNLLNVGIAGIICRLFFLAVISLAIKKDEMLEKQSVLFHFRLIVLICYIVFSSIVIYFSV